MNQKVLGAVRGVGYPILFILITAIIGTIPDILSQIPYIGQFVTPAIGLIITGAAFAWEHALAAKFGYNLTPEQAGSIRQQ